MVFEVPKFLVILLQQQLETDIHADEQLLHFFLPNLAGGLSVTYGFLPNAAGRLYDYIYNFFHT